MPANKKGFTLMELCVVLALCAIVGTMVAAFCVLITDKVAVHGEKKNLQDQLVMFQDGVDVWLGTLDTQDYTFSVQDGVLCATGSGGTEKYTFGLTDGVLCGTVPGGKTIKYPTELLANLSVRLVEGSEGVLASFVVSYEMTKSNVVGVRKITRAIRIAGIAAEVEP